MKSSLILALSCLCLPSVQAQTDRLWLSAKVNGVPVRLSFDTGTSAPFVLFSRTAERLNLKIIQPPADAEIGPGQLRVGWTEPQKLDLGFTNFETAFAVAEVPGYLKLNLDGVLGWPALSSNVFSLNWITQTIQAVTNVPNKVPGWLPCRIQANSDLTLELPGKRSPRQIIALDTGSAYGVELNPEEWRKWKRHHPRQPLTMQAYFTPVAGLVVSEEAWAGTISLGDLPLTEVPVMQADSADLNSHASSHTQYEATFGLAALRRLEIVIDGKHGLAYLRPRNTAPGPYEYNHLGAVFVPQNSTSDDLVAHVAMNSPAAEAGIRDGDILLKIGELDCTQWRTDPEVLPLSRFFERPEGTKLELTVKRGADVLKTKVTLRNIFPADRTTPPIGRS